MLAALVACLSTRRLECPNSTRRALERSPRLDGAVPLLLPADTLEPGAVGLLIHEAAGSGVALGPVAIACLDLRAIPDRAVAVTVTLGRIGGQWSHLLSPLRICPSTLLWTQRLTETLPPAPVGGAASARRSPLPAGQCHRWQAAGRK